MATSNIDRLIDRLWATPDGRPALDVFAIFDGARDDTIYPIVRRCGLEYLCLYAGDLPYALILTAPYLVRLTRNSPAARDLLERSWGNSWGIFLATSTPMKELHRHLRRFLKVKDEEGRSLLFRYYDPRVMRVFLPTCNTEERRTIFGPIQRIIAEDESPTTLIEYRDGMGELIERRVDLSQAPEPVRAWALEKDLSGEEG